MRNSPPSFFFVAAVFSYLKYRRAAILTIGSLLAITLATARETVAYPRLSQLPSAGSEPISIRWHHPTPSSPIPAGEFLAIPVVGVESGQLRDAFEAKRVGHVHHAIDIFAPRGTPVIAAVDGTVGRILENGAGGHTLYLLDQNRQFVYYYAHLDSYAPGLFAGRAIHRGEVVGFVGTSGNAPPNSPHLHFAIEQMTAGGRWWSGIPVNPYPVLTARGVSYDTR
jgi:murein DD-endopeptidase MepM/ murein hydrolase activator NlpD